MGPKAISRCEREEMYHFVDNASLLFQNGQNTPITKHRNQESLLLLSEEGENPNLV